MNGIIIAAIAIRMHMYTYGNHTMNTRIRVAIATQNYMKYQPSILTYMNK